MTIEQAYLLFLTKVNRNLGSSNITADKQRFVLLYNEAQIKKINQVISQGNDEKIREVRFFLKPNTELTFDKKLYDRVLYLLPSDFLDFSSAYALADKSKCKDAKINLWEIKDKNYSQILSDNYNQPSFEYREAPIVFADNKLNLFTSDFDYKKVVLTYYRYPKQVDIEGYINLDGQNSKNIDPEGDDDFVNKVLDMAVLDFSRNYGDIQKIQIEKDRVLTN